MPIAILVAVFLAGGISIGAEASGPGDLLYPVKVGINEEVRGVFDFSQEAKAQWDARRAERRLEEAERLIVSGELSTELASKLESRFTERMESLRDRLAASDLTASGKAKLNSDLEARFTAHENVLLELGTRAKGASKNAIMSLKEHVRAAIDTAAEVRVEAEGALAQANGPDVKAAAEGRKIAAQSKIDEVASFIARRGERISVESKAQAQARVSVAETLVAEGDVELAEGAYAAAFAKYQEAHRTAQEAKIVTTLQHTLQARVAVEEDSSGTDAQSESALEAEGAANAETNSRANAGAGAEINVEVRTNLGL